MVIVILLLSVVLLYFGERLLYRRFWDKGLDIRLRFNGTTAFEGDKGSLTETVENRSFLPLPFVHAKFQIGAGLRFEDRENLKTSDRNYKNDIYSILMYQRITRTLDFTCIHRGYYPVRTADITASDLFYGERYLETVTQNAWFYVYPGRVDISRFEQPLRKMIGDMTSRTYLYPDPFEFRGLRNYTISDPMNTINWKASARTGELMVNQYNSTTSKRIVILLNLEDETVVHHPLLHEESIRIAATLAASLLGQGFPVSFMMNGRDVETKEPVEMLSAQGPGELEDVYKVLARIDGEGDIPEFSPRIRAILEDPDYRSAGYILVSPSMKPELQKAFTELSREAASMWVAPLFGNMNFHVDMETDADVIRWEVDGFA